MKHLNNQLEKSPYNIEVKRAFMQILKEAKAMLATIEHEELRYSLVRDEKNITPIQRVVYEFVNPLIYLRLECNNENLYVIRYGFEMSNSDGQLSNSPAYFTRAVYRLTAKEATGIDIEKCVSNSWCITDCSALYEYIEDRNKHHQFSLIKHKPAAVKRNMKAVA
jgi:hypothetical protein